MGSKKSTILNPENKSNTSFFNKQVHKDNFFQKREEALPVYNEQDIMKKENPSKQTSNDPESNSHSNINHKNRQGHPLPSSVKSRMGSAFGTDFEDVYIHTDPEAATLNDNINAQAFTFGQNIFFNKQKFNPGTIEGDSLLAHELAHTIQQKKENGVSENFDHEAENNADGATEHVLNKLILNERTLENPVLSKKGMSLQRCNRPSAPIIKELTFSQVSTALARPEISGNPAAKEEVLKAGILRARRVARELFNTPTRPPVSVIKNNIQVETGIPLDGNPMTGVSQDSVEQAYRAWAEGAVSEPWILLAIWAKEGLGNTNSETHINAPIPASSEQNARAIYRSRYFYLSTGSDHFGYYEATLTDNVMHFDDSHAALHESTFITRVQEMVDRGYLVRNIAAEINAELTVHRQAAGNFTVVPSSRFRSLALMLTDAFFRFNAHEASLNPAIGPNPDPGLSYMRWNMGATRFNQFVTSADNHRTEAGHRRPDGSSPSVSEWAFHTHVNNIEYGQPRRNAIRFRYFMEVFRNIYEK